MQAMAIAAIGDLAVAKSYYYSKGGLEEMGGFTCKLLTTQKKICYLCA